MIRQPDARPGRTAWSCPICRSGRIEAAACARAAEIQRQPTARGTHRSAGAVDLLIAATAKYQDLSLLHYDRDFDQIAEVTGQPVRWLAPAGTIK
ncbi:PIN domain-containing protein [Micromonospora sp. WMMD737]|uniref:PIN domain-containing protein n=1 Tax=Micromonospora sp. WMMD737 TaxID=3404113 RepID=UPI003B951363